jgi:hypothetical protein
VCLGANPVVRSCEAGGFARRCQRASLRLSSALFIDERPRIALRLKATAGSRSRLATLVTDDLVASSLNRLVARQPLWQNDADDLTRERPVL